MEIKICGINDIESMNAALDNKANYVGLVFYKKSPRNISIELSKELLIRRNSYTKIVVLTVDPDDILISNIIFNIQPDFLQLHGQESPERCKAIKTKFNIPIIKGIGITSKEQLIYSTMKYGDVSDILLLDAPSSKLPGGNGAKFNWKVLKNYNYKKKWMLAGGLKFNNITEAIKITNAPAIDVSSGVEVHKGIKDSKLIKQLITKCKNI
ncbi:MAG: phosphoribosylanthranilate isomerase [Proteobacteria bacterium]|nr:phosphoribosylanthranilate isomerase [Pseudomonadota bacterium]MDA1136202.1 phosphoribosylanthranilate isomerase [Pseudomonadota bacterium]